jgi:hypothetical protein
VSRAAEILEDLTRGLADVFARMQWAEDEIAAAMRRHPQHADRLWHSFAILAPRAEHGDRMGTEPGYRAHCRELLDRVAAGQDTRPGTRVEVIIGLLQAADTAPLNTAGFALLARIWTAARLPDVDHLSDVLGHYEAITGSRVDAEERSARHACRDNSRTLDAPNCDGYHHGQPIACVYAAPADLLDPIQ